MYCFDLRGTRQHGPAALLGLLLHDAHEAYVGDLSTPFKSIIGPAYKRITGRLDSVIWEAVTGDAYGRHAMTSPYVREIDHRALLNEAWYLMENHGRPYINQAWLTEPPLFNGPRVGQDRSAEFRRVVTVLARGVRL